MAEIKHKFVSQVADVADETVVRPSDWNEEHDFSGFALEGHTHEWDELESSASWMPFNTAPDGVPVEPGTLLCQYTHGFTLPVRSGRM